MEKLTKKQLEKKRINSKRYRDNNKEKIKASSKRYYEENKEKIDRQHKEYYSNNKDKAKEYYRQYSKGYNLKNRERFRKYAKELNRKIRKKLIDMMGGKCVRCGFDDGRALQVDHIDGGGHKERQNALSKNFNRRVIKSVESNENKFQLLCANCNWIKRCENKEVRSSESTVI